MHLFKTRNIIRSKRGKRLNTILLILERFLNPTRTVGILGKLLNPEGRLRGKHPINQAAISKQAHSGQQQETVLYLARSCVVALVCNIYLTNGGKLTVEKLCNTLIHLGPRMS